MVKIFFVTVLDANKVTEYIKNCKYCSREFKVEMYSEEGLFLLEQRANDKRSGLKNEDNLYKLLAIDLTPEKMIIGNTHLLIDYSYFEREPVYQLPSDYIKINCKYAYYKLHNKSQVRLVVKTLIDGLKEYYYLEILGENNDILLGDSSVINELNELVSSLS